eukprot:6182191-Pleurochrysis_carterae.AAC.1
MRAELQKHYSSTTRTYSRSFVVGSRNDVCAQAFALACGVSVQTYSNSSADCRLDRVRHNGRCQTRDKLQSDVRTFIEAYIRDLRSAMEGDKGGASFDHYYTGSRSGNLRFKDYKSFCMSRSLPVLGSESLFKRIWREHTEIREYSAKSHPKCDECGLIESALDRLGFANDAEAVAERKTLNEAQ